VRHDDLNDERREVVMVALGAAGLPGGMEAAGIDPASADAPD
jgi:hypothetical protein